MAKFLGGRYGSNYTPDEGHQHADPVSSQNDVASPAEGGLESGLLSDTPTHGYHDELGIGRVVWDDGSVIFTGRGPQEASVDGQGGTIRDKPVFTIDQAAYYLNRGDGPIVEGGVTYYSGANWDNAPGFNNDYYFTAIGKNNGGKAESFYQGGDADANGTLTTINFGFYETQATLPEPYVYRNTAGNLVIGQAVASGFSTFSPAQRAAAREAIQSWDDLVAVKFQETPFQQGDINFMNTTSGPAQASAYLPYDYGNSSVKNSQGKNVSFYEISGDVYVATPSKNASNGQLDEGQYGLTTLVHELGHSLGLEHPGAYNFAPGFAVTYEGGAEYYQDSNMYSIMSYWDGEETGAHFVDWQYMNYYYASTPMVHDVAAIQRIYGADMTTRTGDTTYGFNASADTAGRDSFNFDLTPYPVMTIWDAGGNDTLDLSGFKTNSVIDLAPGSYSSAGGFFSANFPTLEEINARRAADGRVPRTQAQYDQYKALFGDTYNNGLMTDNIGIAYGAIIENAVGGAGDDIISGNDVANILSGKAGVDKINGGLGNDTLVGGAGADVLDGGEGLDIASYRDAAGAITLTVNSGGRATVSGDGVGDTYISIEGYEGSAFGDTMTGTTAADILFGGGGDDFIDGGNANDKLDGGAGNDRVEGGNGHDQLLGRSGVDTLLGGSGNDVLVGGAGADVLSGGSGSDVFTFINAADIGTAAGAHDRITDFAISADKIDISALYSSAAAQSGLAFRTDGNRMTSTGSEAAGRAYDVSVYSEGGKTFVVGDTTGDGIADFGLELTGTLKLKASDFITTQTQWNDFFSKIAQPTDYSALHTDVLV
jgi:serralysin